MLAALAAAVLAAYLLDARADEVRLADAQRAAAIGDLRAARAESSGLRGRTTEGRAAVARATAAIRAGALPDAVRDLRLAVRRRPNDWRVRRDLAVVLAFRGDRARARRQIEHALELNPRMTLPRAFVVMGR